MNKFFRDGEKFMLLYRFDYELDGVEEKFYKDIGSLFFDGTTMSSKSKARGCYKELYINEKPCGYAVSLNKADALKKYSHLLSDTKRMFMDEFQSETNHYTSDEVSKLMSIHTSVARGHGEQVRYVPVYMCANPVSLLNPYYVALGVSSRLTKETKFLKGDGFVLEQGYVESADMAQRQSGFMRAFANEKYSAYSGQGVYLNDNEAFIEKPTGIGKYVATLKYNGTDYALREYGEQGIIYCDTRPDMTYPLRISITTDDHQVNYVMLKQNDIFFSTLRYYFDHGCFRFRDLRCKECVLTALSY